MYLWKGLMVRVGAWSVKRAVIVVVAFIIAISIAIGWK